jgi:glycosyltransferase involved in cell wall biosynthesis
MRVSVCMATYNGSKYIEIQLRSVLRQLDHDDEVIIVDDKSVDNTTEIINSFSDSRIKLLLNEVNLGVVQSFQIAILSASNDCVFLCDQDDVWHQDKVRSFKDVFKNNADVTLVISNAEIINKDGKGTGVYFYKNGIKRSLASNLISNSYLGCCMAFRKGAIRRVFPFPADLPMHDYWLGLNHLLYGKIIYLQNVLMGYRRHENNVTTGKRASLKTIIYWRFILIKSLVVRALIYIK